MNIKITARDGTACACISNLFRIFHNVWNIFLADGRCATDCCRRFLAHFVRCFQFRISNPIVKFKSVCIKCSGKVRQSENAIIFLEGKLEWQSRTVEILNLSLEKSMNGGAEAHGMQNLKWAKQSRAMKNAAG